MKRLFAEHELDEGDPLTAARGALAHRPLEERGPRPLGGEARGVRRGGAGGPRPLRRPTRRRWPGPAPSTSATSWSGRCSSSRRTRRCGPAGPAASATSWWTSSRTPTRSSTGCSSSWSGRAGTSAWWATTTRPSTAGAAPTCATSSTSTTTSPAAGWSSWSGTTAPPATSSTRPTPSSRGPGCGARSGSGPRPGRATRWRCWWGRTSTTRPSGWPAPWLAEQARGTRGDEIAVLYRTNAQSRAPSRPQLRAARVPYVIVRGTSFYDRAEVKDAAAYLRLALSPSSDLDLERIVNRPPRGIGEKTVERLRAHAAAPRPLALRGHRRRGTRWRG